MAFSSSYTTGLLQQSEFYYGDPDVILTGSFSGSFVGDGSSLTGVGAFPFTGSANISGSLSVEGPAGNITASGDISASGTIIASNLSGTNTGDQDLAAYALTANVVANNATASFVNNSATSSFVTNSQTGSFLTNDDTGSLGSTTITGSLTISGSSSPLLSLPDASNTAIVISGSNDGTRLHIYDTEDNTSPVYTEGAGIVLTGGEGAAQAILEMSAVGSTNGGSNNEQTFIRSSEMLTIVGASAAAGDNIKLLGSSNYGLKLDASTSAVSLQFIANGGSTVSTLELANGTYTKADSSGTYYKVGRSSTDWLNLSSTQATFNRHVSSSAISTASFGTYLGDGSQLTGLPSPTFISSGSTSASAAPDTGVVVEHSGSTAFSVIGDVGTLFAVDDDLTNTLFSVNDVSGFPVLQASASGDVFIGKTPQSLYTTAVVSSTVGSTTTESIYNINTSSYDGAFFEYTAVSQSNARAGTILSVWANQTCSFADTSTRDIGDTSAIIIKPIISGSTARLVVYGAAGYKVKTTVKAI